MVRVRGGLVVGGRRAMRRRGGGVVRVFVCVGDDGEIEEWNIVDDGEGGGGESV